MPHQPRGRPSDVAGTLTYHAIWHVDMASTLNWLKLISEISKMCQKKPLKFFKMCQKSPKFQNFSSSLLQTLNF